MNGSRTNISLKIWAQQEPKCDSLWLLLGWQPLPISEKPLFHGASLQEGLNWLPEEGRVNRGGGFRPTCRYVLYYCHYCPWIGAIVTLPLVCVCSGYLSLLGLLGQEPQPAVKILPCLLPSLKIKSFLLSLSPSPTKPSPLFPRHHPLCCCSRLPWQPASSALKPCTWSVFCLGRTKFVLLFPPLWDVLTMVVVESLDGAWAAFFLSQPQPCDGNCQTFLVSSFQPRGVALHPWSTLSPYLGMFGDLGWLVGSLWLCLAVIFVHTMSACADSSAALSRDQMEMLDSLSLFKPVESRKRSPSWFLPLKQLLNFQYYIHLGSMLGFWIASIFSLPRNYHSSHHLPTILCCALDFSVNFLLTAD